MMFLDGGASTFNVTSVVNANVPSLPQSSFRGLSLVLYHQIIQISTICRPHNRCYVCEFLVWETLSYFVLSFFIRKFLKNIFINATF
jgi:PP-loop superfamily ATP-utilizing enzyme